MGILAHAFGCVAILCFAYLATSRAKVGVNPLHASVRVLLLHVVDDAGIFVRHTESYHPMRIDLVGVDASAEQGQSQTESVQRVSVDAEACEEQEQALAV